MARETSEAPPGMDYRPQTEACGSDRVHQEFLGGWLTRKNGAASTSPNRGKNEVDSVADRSVELHNEDGDR